MDKTDSGYKKSIKKLEEEITHLRNMLRLMGKGEEESLFSIPLEPYSISGIENMYLQVNNERVIVNTNSKMAILIGLDKSQIIGKKVFEIDNIPWAKNVFTTLITECSRNKSDIEWETSYFDTVSGKLKYILFRASGESNIITLTATDRTEFKEILNTFSRYVSPKVIKKMQDSSDDFFKTERVNLTVIFADLRGFTSMSSEMDPLAVKDILNDFFSSLIDVVDRYEGTVDKLVGDEIMVLFGAPYPMVDHSYRAVKTAIEMQLAHMKLQKKWLADKLPAPPLGIGLNSGKVVVGNIGSETRMDYTAIGHNVNLASRLCSRAEGGEILVSESTVLDLYDYINNSLNPKFEKIQFQKAGKMIFKGLKHETTVARVLYKKEGDFNG